MSTCVHGTFRHRACRDPFLDLFVCADCGRGFVTPRIIPRPRLSVLKQALRSARSMAAHPGPPRAWYELAVASKDVAYLSAFLVQAGIRVQVPEYASQLLISPR